MMLYLTLLITTKDILKDMQPNEVTQGKVQKGFPQVNGVVGISSTGTSVLWRGGVPHSWHLEVHGNLGSSLNPVLWGFTEASLDRYD